MKLKDGPIDAEFIARLQMQNTCVNIDAAVDEMKKNARYKKPKQATKEEEYARIAKNSTQ